MTDSDKRGKAKRSKKERGGAIRRDGWIKKQVRFQNKMEETEENEARKKDK